MENLHLAAAVNPSFPFAMGYFLSLSLEALGGMACL